MLFRSLARRKGPKRPLRVRVPSGYKSTGPLSERHAWESLRVLMAISATCLGVSSAWLWPICVDWATKRVFRPAAAILRKAAEYTFGPATTSMSSAK